MRSGASGMLLATLEGGGRSLNKRVEDASSAPSRGLDRDQFFAIITQKGGRRASGQETDPSCSSTTDYVRTEGQRTYAEGSFEGSSCAGERKKKKRRKKERVARRPSPPNHQD